MNTADKILQSLIDNSKTPSVQYRVFTKDTLLHSFHGGLADIAQNIRATEQTLYSAYSVTKTFTALAILQLAEQDKINIDNPAINYLPEFPYSQNITVRNLLTHTAGIPNPIPLSWIHLAHEHTLFNRNQFFNSVTAKNPKTKSNQNEKFSYSNLGYVMLGRLIEKVSGTSYEKYISENILSKLKIEKADLDFVINNENVHATGYHKRFSISNALLGFFIDKEKFMGEPAGAWKPFQPFYINGTSYGGLIGNANSLAKYIQELLKTDSGLITGKIKEQLFAENHTNDGKSTGMCISWYTGNLNGKEYFTHAGGGGGYYCEIRIYKKTGMGSVIMFNRTGMTDERFLDNVDQYFLS